MALFRQSIVQVTTGRIEAGRRLGAVEELMADQPISVLGQFDEALVFAGLPFAGNETVAGTFSRAAVPGAGFLQRAGGGDTLVWQSGRRPEEGVKGVYIDD